MGKYFLAIDYGEKKCGLALADEENKIATAYKNILTLELFFVLDKIMKENEVARIIVGNFREMGKSILLKNGKKEKIVQQLKNRYNIKIEFEDESFTSRMAQEKLKETTKKNISQKDDAEAAQIILQSWLDKNL